MPNYGLMFVEGPHDAELAYRLLSPFGLRRVQWLFEVSPFLASLIPRGYPPESGDLQMRVSTPLFLANTTHAIAIQRAEGDARLVPAVQESLAILDNAQLTGLGILLDADSAKSVSAADRYAALQAGMTALGYPLPPVPGEVSTGTPRVGAFVLPDNSSPGTLEDLLIECAMTAYPTLLDSARTHAATADADANLTPHDLKDFRKPSGRNKAIVGSIASILRPGKAVQVSIQDNRWLRDECLKLPRVRAIQDFLRTLFDLSP